MIPLLIFFVSLFSSIVGGICGIGGGIVIKPVLDAAGVMSVSCVSFLSGCTVLSMSAVSFFRNRQSKGVIEIRTGTALAVGSVLGGLLGKAVFDLFGNEDFLGAAQAVLLLLITMGALLYARFASEIKTHCVRNGFACGLIGLALGTMSAFWGIGGGPVNLTVLSFFFSMDTKKAAANSLYIILLSQTASLLQTWIKRMIPPVSPEILVLMVLAGILGGLIGNKIHRKISAAGVTRLFTGFMIAIIIINLYNTAKFLIR